MASRKSVNSEVEEVRGAAVSEVMERWQGCRSEGEAPVANWRKAALAHLRDGNVQAMRREALPTVQFELLALAHEAREEKTRLAACQFVMGQEGQGVVQRIDHRIQYDQMTTPQLEALLRSRLTLLQQLHPGLQLPAMPGVTIEASVCQDNVDHE